MAGDTPLLRGRDARRRWSPTHAAAGRAVTVLTGEVADPFGYGRIVRDADGAVTAIVEEKDADRRAGARSARSTAAIFAFDGGVPRRRARPDHQRQRQGRVLPHRRASAIARADGAHRSARTAIDDVMQTEGANDRAQLADARPPS